MPSTFSPRSQEATDPFPPSGPARDAVEEAGEPAPSLLLQPPWPAGLLDQPPEALPSRQHVALAQEKALGPPWQHRRVRSGIHSLAERRSIQAQPHVSKHFTGVRGRLPGWEWGRGTEGAMGRLGDPRGGSVLTGILPPPCPCDT